MIKKNYNIISEGKMTKIEITDIKLQNFRSIKSSHISLKQDNILVGKNNIGKTSIIEAFDAFNSKISLSDFNIDLLIKLMECRNDVSNISADDSLGLTVKYEWEDLPIDYWHFLSDIQNSGETILNINFSIPKENYELLKKVSHVKELLDLFVKKVTIGSPKDFMNKTESILPSNYSLNKYLPHMQSNFSNVKKGEVIMFSIMAFRFVDRGKSGNQGATESQFSEKVSAMITKDEQVEALFDDLQGQIDTQVTPKMTTLQSDLKHFAYPSNPENPLKAILTIDEWFDNPKVRISQTFPKLSGFELPLNSQGLGYQNIYNIIARISASFTQMENLGLQNPILFVIEEPEAFTHPQLQHIFIQQISNFVQDQSQKLNIPYQLFIISHSPEMAVSAIELNFELIIGRQINNATSFINWNSLGDEEGIGRKKFKKLLLNYNAEMLFADKLIAYEGNAEKIIFSAIIRQNSPELLSEKIAFIPVGTSFRTYESVISDLNYEKVLLITDIDYKVTDQSWDINPKLQRSEPIITTNANLKYLFNSPEETLNTLDLTDFIQDSKTIGYIFKLRSLPTKYRQTTVEEENFMIVTQGWNKTYNFLPRTLESAMVTNTSENISLYENKGLVKSEEINKINSQAFELNDVENKLLKKGKADFALESLEIISTPDFSTPAYLLNGLKWLVD